jgi:serine/threonine protein kinase
MADFLRRMADVFYLFEKAGVVHADLKPDNIIIDFDE